MLSDDAVDRIAQQRTGDLQDVPFAVLLYAFARAERSVTLEITRKPLVKQIVIEGGVPVECRSNLAHETLSRFMQSDGLLDEATANECFAEACARGERFGDVLIDRGLITAEELRKILQRNLAKKLLDGFAWLQGSYKLSEVPTDIDSTLKVNVAQLIILGVTRFATQQQVDTSVGPLIGKPLALHPSPVFALDDIRMTERQRAIISALGGGPRRIDELASSTGIPFDDLTRAIYGFTLIGAVARAGRIEPTTPPDRVHPPSRPATTPSTPSTPSTPKLGPTAEDTEDRRAALMEMVLNYRRKDAFDLLGVDPDGFGRESQDRFLAFAEEFAPWSFPPDLAGDARRVFLAGVRAFGELADPDRRQALIDRRRQPVRTTAAGANPFRIETDLLDPEVQFRQGRALMREGNYRDALEQLGYASDLDPQNGDYRAELAYCRYLFQPQVGGPVALDELKQALRIDPRSGLVHFYRGEILRDMGRPDEAEACYRRAIRPMAPDRRPIDALKGLRRKS